MIRLPIASFHNQVFTILRPQGEPLSLDVGEIIRAEVISILPSGGTILKIKGTLITAKTEVPLQKGATVLLKVPSRSSDKGEIGLRLIGHAQDPDPVESPPDLKGRALNTVLRDLSGALAHKGRAGTGLTEIVESLIKVLPSDSTSLSEELRVRLQNLLQMTLRTTGQGIQARLEHFLFHEMPGVMGDHPLVEGLKKNLMIAMERLLSAPLKESIEDTGIGLEAKLRISPGRREKAASDAGGSPSMTEEGEGEKSGPTEEKHPLPFRGPSPVDRDLKGGLLKLRQLLSDGGRDDSLELPVHNLTREQRGKVTRTLDGILRDIETFQALSKTTDSLYTFLPLRWSALKDGEIILKQGRADGGDTPFSCRMNLDLEELGKVAVVIIMNKGDFLVSLSVENGRLQSVLNSHSHDLEEAFRRQGLRLKTFTLLEKSGPTLQHLERLASFERIVNLKV